MRRVGTAVVLALSVAVLMTGCGADDPGAADARAVATAFTDEASRDAAAACRLLAPATLQALERRSGDCPSALRDEPVDRLAEIGSVEVAGRGARVLDRRGDALFLTVIDGGWRVTAAGCRRVAEDLSVPYDCVVEKG